MNPLTVYTLQGSERIIPDEIIGEFAIHHTLTVKGFNSTFAVTHIPSGLCVLMSIPSIDMAQRFAQKLMSYPIDWQNVTAENAAQMEHTEKARNLIKRWLPKVGKQTWQSKAVKNESQ